MSVRPTPLFGLVLVSMAFSCGPQSGEASPESCLADEACQTHGRCTYDRHNGKCVVGSSADCERAKICQKENRCQKVGEVCDKAE